MNYKLRYVSLENLGHYKIETEEPEWMRLERYDYCEEFQDHKKARKTPHKLLALLAAIF